jgi:hypothetical protein
MPNEYTQYSLIKQLSEGSKVGTELLGAYRAGKEYAAKEKADTQKAKLVDLSIKQGVAKLKAQQVSNDKAALELEQLKKQVPVIDAQTALKLNELATQTQVQPEQLQLAALKVHDQLESYPQEQRAQMLQTFGTNVQQLASLPPDEYAAALKQPDNKVWADKFGLTGNVEVDAPIIRAMTYAGHPEIQAGLEKNAADNAAKLRGIEITVAGRQQVAALKANASIQTHAMSLANTKATLPTPAEVRVASYALANDPDLASVGPKDVPKVATLYASLIKSYAQAARQGGQQITTIQAQDLAMSRLKAAIELSNPADPSFLGQVKEKLGITTATIPSVTDLVKDNPTGGTAAPESEPKTTDIESLVNKYAK